MSRLARLVLRCAALVAALAPIAAAPARADEFRPAYLQLVQRDSVTFDVLWKLPALDETTTLRLQPVFPDGTVDLLSRSSAFANGAAVQRWRIRVPGGLFGRDVAFPELANQRVDVLVRVVRLDGTAQVGRLTPVERTFRVTSSPGPFEVARTYTLLGIEHILLGVDHLLFVLALVLIVEGTRQLLLTITAFTVAHSISLALATLGVVHVPGPPVEAIIALSIVFVAAEILHRQRGTAGLAATKPWVVAFTFGLLHGLGFAGALAQVGLPANAIPLSLLCFNVGVELGQLAFVGALLAVGHVVRRRSAPPRRRRLVAATAYAIGGLASFWVVERIAKFWSA